MSSTTKQIILFLVALIAIISGGLLAYLQPDKWQGLALIPAGLLCGYAAWRGWRFDNYATAEQKQIARKKEKRTRFWIELTLLVGFVLVFLLAIVTLGVGFILDRAGERVGETIMHIAIYANAAYALIFLVYFTFFAKPD